MKAGGGKRKGSQFEREIAKSLSLWITNNKRDDVFWLSSQSGGRSTQRKKSGQTTANSSGDICYLDAIGKPFTDYFLIECKNGYTKEVDVLNTVDSSGELILLKWFSKAQKECNEAKKKQVMLIFKRNRKKPCIMMESNFLGFLESSKNKEYMERQIEICLNEFVIVNYKEFFKWFTSDFFKK